MAGNSAFVTYVFVICLCGVTSATAPAFQARITSAGFHYANEVAIQKLSTKVVGEKFNVPERKAGDVTYSVTNARITSFTAPSSRSLKPVQGVGLKWSASDIGLAMKGDFKFSFKKGFIRISDHGSFDISVSGVRFSVTAKFGKDSTGRPSIQAGPCNCDISRVSIKFHGRWAWVYNAIRGQIEGKMRDSLKGKMCDVVSQLIDNEAEKVLSKLKVTADIGTQFLLDYRLVNPPIFHSEYMETQHKCEIDWKAAPGAPPFSPPPVPAWSDTSRMVYLWISDYMMNSLLYQAQKHGVLAKTVTAQDLPANSRGVLNTTCPDAMCIGNLIPALQKEYPNCQLELRMKSTLDPKVGVVGGQVQAKLGGTIAIYASCGDRSSTLYFKPGRMENTLENRLKGPPVKSAYVFTMEVSMNITGGISIAEEVIHYNVSNMTANVRVLNTTIAHVKETALNFIINYAVKKYIQPNIDDLGRIGIPLPLNGIVTMKNTQIKLLQNAFVVATDLVYKPTKDI